jgi:hypothetical protein
MAIPGEWDKMLLARLADESAIRSLIGRYTSAIDWLILGRRRSQ